MEPTTIFTTPSCMQCRMTERALKEHSIPYRTIDVTEDAVALLRIKALGYTQAPVVTTGNGEHWSGFQPDRIRELAAELEGPLLCS